MFFEDPIQVRLTKEWMDKLKIILLEYPAVFETKTQIIRAGIIKIWEEHENGKLKQRNAENQNL